MFHNRFLENTKLVFQKVDQIYLFDCILCINENTLLQFYSLEKVEEIISRKLLANLKASQYVGR